MLDRILALTDCIYSLKTSIIELGVGWEKSLTLDTLDVQFDELRRRVQEADQSNTLVKPLLQDPARANLGAVLAEAISAAFWSDATMVSMLDIRMGQS